MYKIHTVEANETIDIISNNLQITSSELRKINGFSPNYEVSVGEQIIVPVTRASYFDTYVVKSGDTIYDIARLHDVGVDDLLSLNGLERDDYIYPNQQLLVPKANVNFYITKENDTLTSVVETLKMSLEEMYRDNPVIYLQPDQLIIVKEWKTLFFYYNMGYNIKKE